MSGRNNQPPHDPAMDAMIRQQLLDQQLQDAKGQQRVSLPPQIAMLPQVVAGHNDLIGDLADRVDAMESAMTEAMTAEQQETYAADLQSRREERVICSSPRTPLVLWSEERVAPEVSYVTIQRTEDGPIEIHLFAHPSSPLHGDLDRQVFVEADLGKARVAATDKVFVAKMRAHRDGKYRAELLTPHPEDPQLPPDMIERLHKKMRGSVLSGGKLGVVR